MEVEGRRFAFLEARTAGRETVERRFFDFEEGCTSTGRDGRRALEVVECALAGGGEESSSSSSGSDSESSSSSSSSSESEDATEERDEREEITEPANLEGAGSGTSRRFEVEAVVGGGAGGAHCAFGGGGGAVAE